MYCCKMLITIPTLTRYPEFNAMFPAEPESALPLCLVCDILSSKPRKYMCLSHCQLTVQALLCVQEGLPWASASSPGTFSKAFCTRTPMAVTMAERREYALPPR